MKSDPTSSDGEYLRSIEAIVRAQREAAAGDVNVAHRNAMPHPEQLLALSDLISEVRARRKSFLPEELFAEPGWEMLLALYRAHAAGHRMSVSNMCFASGAPDTTALRWIDKLEELGMVKRRKNPLDARMVFIELEPKARLLVEDYLMETWVKLFAAKDGPNRIK